MLPHAKASGVCHWVQCDLWSLLPWSSHGLRARVASLPHTHAMQEAMVQATAGSHTRGTKPKRGNRG